MRKLLVFSIMVLAMMAFMAAPTFACGGEKATTAKADGNAKAEMVSSKSGCSGDAKEAKAEMVSSKSGCASKASAEMVSSKSGCASAAKAEMASADKGACAMSMEECLAKCGMTPEECKTYSDNTKYELVNMNISGMTCGGCESQVRATLASVKGVEKVAKVDHKSGTALVVMAKGNACGETLTTAVTNKGYKAEVIPAVAHAETASADKAGCAASKAACAATCADKAKATNVSAKTEGTN